MTRWVPVAALLLVLTVAAPVAAHDGPHVPDGDGRVGVLLVDHGEPPEYTEDTYASFRAFFSHLMQLGVIPWWLRTLDRGTVLYDRACPGCDRRDAPELMDAWLQSYDGPAVFQPQLSETMPAHYVLPHGPGLGEPDIFELIGLSAWHEWELMGGRSPNYDQKLPKKRAAIRRLRARFGRELPVRVGYHIDPWIGGRTQGVRRAMTQLIRRDRVDHIAVVYHGVGFSDIMQTHMIRHEIETLRHQLNPDVTLTYGRPMGTTRDYVRGVVDHVLDQVAAVPRHQHVAIHLSEHGLPTTDCGDYDCGGDAYHQHAAAMFRRTRTAIRRALTRIERPGRVGVFQIYGDGGEGDDDPDDLVDSPTEALRKRARAGFHRVIDIPYAFDADSRDTLIVLRRGYRRTPPDWDANLESRFHRHSMRVRITNAQFGTHNEIRALTRVAADTIRATLRGEHDGGASDQEHQH